MPTKIISCVNLKGGVGKTAIATNLAAFCGRNGKRTLLVDLDSSDQLNFLLHGLSMSVISWRAISWSELEGNRAGEAHDVLRVTTTVEARNAPV